MCFCVLKKTKRTKNKTKENYFENIKEKEKLTVVHLPKLRCLHKVGVDGARKCAHSNLMKMSCDVPLATPRQ